MGNSLEFMANFITQNIPYFILGMTVLLALSLIVFININVKLAKMNKRYKKLMTGMDGVNIERLLMGHIDEVRSMVKRFDEMEGENRRIDVMANNSVQKIGVIRFSAFENIGSDLSYAVAMLDNHNNGVVFSSLFAREDSRCYVKPIENGQSSYVLTTEEQQAIDKAMGRK
jgi:hypothetical protein